MNNLIFDGVRNAVDVSFSSSNLERRYVFVGFNFEKLLSPLATITGIVNEILNDNPDVWESVTHIFDCNKYISILLLEKIRGFR